MALNDIIVPKENASATFDEVVLTGAQIGLEKPATGNASSTQVVLGNDTRLSDARTPSSTLAHAASHGSAGSDPLAPSDIGAQSIFVTEDLGTVTANVTLTAARAKIYTLNTTTSGLRILLPASSVLAGDIVQIRFSSVTGQSITPVRGTMTGFFTDNIGPIGGPVTFIAASASGTSWTIAPVDRHTHGNIGDQGNIGTTSGLPVKTGASGVLEAGAFGTSAGQFAEGNHSHGNINSSGQVGSTSGLPLVTTTAGAVTTLALGTAGQVLTVNSGATGVEFAAASGGGVTTGNVDNAVLRADGTGGSTSQNSAFIIADNATASPNNTVNHASIQATGGTTNVSVSIVPKGTGAFSLHVPDGTSAGGNARGVRSCDFQRSRSSAAQVASGEDSFIAGGANNTASGQRAFLGGSNDSTASGISSAVIASWSGTASQGRSTVISSFNSTASGEQSCIISGNASSATQEGAVAIGRSAVADLRNVIAEGNGGFNAQHLRFGLRGTTTTNAAVELLGGTGSDRFRCPSGKVMFINIMIVGVSNGGGTVATFQRQYAIKNVGGTTSEVYAPVTIGTDSAASTSITVDANDTNDALRVQCTGLSATTIRWVAQISAVELSHG